MHARTSLHRLFLSLAALALLAGSCAPAPGVWAGVESNPKQPPNSEAPLAEANPAEQTASAELTEAAPQPTPYPSRPLYQPGELVDYTAQTGDTLPALAVRFNTTVEEIRAANPFIPDSATTMPPGMPMKIPIYYLPLWGPAYLILPDSLFVNGPFQVGFDAEEFVQSQPGWLKDYRSYASGRNLSGAQVVEVIAQNYSVSPRLLLALLEYQAGALSNPVIPEGSEPYFLGHRAYDRAGLYNQLGWAANWLNNGYYAWRMGLLKTIEYRSGRIERLDPWLNATTASLHNYFNSIFAEGHYLEAVGHNGLAQTYAQLFGDPWAGQDGHIPGSLTQPEFRLPFEPGKVWSFTGGPHTGWGNGLPYAALDFAPPLKSSGCQESSEWATAVAPGVVVRTDTGLAVLDLDGDADERTGWTVMYLHVAEEGRVPVGAQVQVGERVGKPSCEGGSSTGTHVHIARKYNGEWIPAEGTLAFNLEGWTAHNGSRAYLGTLTRFTETVTACECSNRPSWIQAQERFGANP